MAGGGRRPITGYRYLFDIHMGLSRGPVDRIVDVRVGGISIGPAENGVNNINQPQLFGGDEKEGGIRGSLQVFLGGDDQVVSSSIKSRLGGLVSNWRGVVSVFYSGVIATNNPYPKPWEFRVRRALNGWDGEVWYPNRAQIFMEGSTVVAMNPAHIIYECLTNRSWGRGLPRTALDNEAFTDAANALCSEGFGLCLKWTRQGDLDEFVNSVINHIGAALYVNRGTGLWTLRLIRADYDPGSLPVFDYNSGLLAIEEDESGARDTAINEIIVKFFDPVRKSERSVREQDLAAFASQGAVYSTTQDYPGIPTENLARRVARRDLEAQSQQLRRFKLRLDRRAWNIPPAGVFRISVPSRGITNMVVRAGKISDTTLTDGTITIDAVQDVFSMPVTGYSGVVESAWTPPPDVLPPIETRLVSESTHLDLVATLPAADFAALTPGTSILLTQAVQPVSTALDYVVETSTGSGFTERAVAPFTPTGTLVAALGATDTEAVLENVSSLDAFNVPSAARISYLGREEIIRVSAWDESTSTITFTRGCVDTIPQDFPVGSRVWLYEDGAGADEQQYAAGEIVSVRLLPRSNSLAFDPAFAGVDNITATRRRERPYPPGRVRVNGISYLALGPDLGPWTFTWTHRDRVVQADQLLDHYAENVGPEPGTTYTLAIYNDAILLRQFTGIVGTTQDYTLAQWTADGSLTQFRVLLFAVRDGLESFQRYDFTVRLTAAGAAGFDLGFDFDFDGTGT